MNNENDNKNRSKLKKVILNICKYLIYIVIFILGLWLIVSLFAKGSEVSALSQTIELDINNNDLENKNYVLYFQPFENSLPINNEYFISVSVSNNGNGAWNNYVRIKRVADNGYQVYNGNQSTYIGTPGIYDFIAIAFEKNNSTSCIITTYYYKYIDINTYNYQIIGQATVASYNGNIQLRFNSQFWLKTYYYNLNANSLEDNIWYGYTTNRQFTTEEYRQDHLFGDLVSSFLNIKLGQVAVGNTTYNLTLGLLLLFILGLGALFIIIKIFLGG